MQTSVTGSFSGESTQKKSRIAFFLITGMLVVLPLWFLGCQSSAPEPGREKKSETTSSVREESGGPAHTISPQTVEEILQDTRKDIAIITGVESETKDLKKAMTGPALKDMIETIERDLNAGKMKIRDYADVKLSMKNFTQGIAGVTLEFVDRSYYRDTTTNEPLTKPENTPRRYILSLKKAQGTWKINDTYSQQETLQKGK